MDLGRMPGATGRIDFATYVDAGNLMRWRLVAANGRTIGVSAGRFDSTAEAWADLRSVQARAESIVSNLVHPSSGVGWFWSASDAAGSLVARGGRSYERRATCVQGFARFQRALKLVGLDYPKRPLT